MQLSHAWSRATPIFDDDGLVSCAGLVPVMALAERAGLSELISAKVAFKQCKVKSAGGESGGQADVGHRRDGGRRGLHR